MNCMTPRTSAVMIFTAGASVLAAQDVHAYIDPGTGSYMLQLMAAALLGASFTAKVYWRKIKLFFTKHLVRDQEKEKPL